MLLHCTCVSWGQVGRRTITHSVLVFFPSVFFLFFCLICPGCTHYPAALGNANELRGSPAVSPCDLQYISVSLVKSRPYFPLGISVSLRGCFELLNANEGQRLTPVARCLLCI